jgi:hypothetical protein
MPGHVGDALLEVLHMGAGLEACDVPAHEDAAQLWAGGRGLPLRVACDVEGVIFIPVEERGPQAAIFDAAADAKVHHFLEVA